MNFQVDYNRNNELSNEMLPLSMKKYKNQMKEREGLFGEKQKPVKNLSPYSYERFKNTELASFKVEKETIKEKENERELMSHTPSKRKSYKYYFD